MIQKYEAKIPANINLEEGEAIVKFEAQNTWNKKWFDFVNSFVK